MGADDTLRIQGSHTYTSTLPSIVLKTFELPLQDASLTSAVLSTNDSGVVLTICVHFNGPVSSEQVRFLTDEAARKMVNRLAFHLNAFLKEPEFVAGSFTKIHADGHNEYFEESIVRARFTARAEDIHYYGDEAMACLQHILGATAVVPGEGQFDLYRTLMAGSDSVAKFLAFYLVLMSAHNDSQRDLDAFILRWEPTVVYAKTDPPRGRKTDWTYETVYTRLRNQVGHSRGFALRDTRAEMDAHMTGLMTLVRKCIEVNG